MNHPVAYNAIVDSAYVGAEGVRVNRIKMYTHVTSVLNDAPTNLTKPYVIFIKNGRYYDALFFHR